MEPELAEEDPEIPEVPELPPDLMELEVLGLETLSFLKFGVKNLFFQV